jgi:hypothetical protein
MAIGLSDVRFYTAQCPLLTQSGHEWRRKISNANPPTNGIQCPRHQMAAMILRLVLQLEQVPYLSQ